MIVRVPGVSDEDGRRQALARVRPTRKALRPAELPEDVAATLGAGDYGHIDRDLDKLMDQSVERLG